MKTFYFIACTAILLLVIKSSLFACAEQCRAGSCSKKQMPYTAAKNTTTVIAETETNPFTILIPGNHF